MSVPPGIAVSQTDGDRSLATLIGPATLNGAPIPSKLNQTRVGVGCARGEGGRTGYRDARTGTTRARVEEALAGAAATAWPRKVRAARAATILFFYSGRENRASHGVLSPLSTRSGRLPGPTLGDARGPAACCEGPQSRGLVDHCPRPSREGRSKDDVSQRGVGASRSWPPGAHGRPACGLLLLPCLRLRARWRAARVAEEGSGGFVWCCAGAPGRPAPRQRAAPPPPPPSSGPRATMHPRRVEGEASGACERAETGGQERRGDGRSGAKRRRRRGPRPRAQGGQGKRPLRPSFPPLAPCVPALVRARVRRPRGGRLRCYAATLPQLRAAPRLRPRVRACVSGAPAEEEEEEVVGVVGGGIGIASAAR
eukprot:scaffold4768_cov412-Prasinococcus_capsulatus_cf.AAC.17